MPKAEDFLKQYMPPESGAGLAARPSAEAFLADYAKPEEQREIAAGKRRAEQRDAAAQQRQADEEMAMMAAGAFPSSLIDPETARTGLEILGTVGLGFLAPQAAIPAGMARAPALWLKGKNLLSRAAAAGIGAGGASLATEPLAPSPPGEVLPEALQKALYGAGGEVAGTAIAAGAAKTAAPFARKIEPMYQAAKTRLKGMVTPAEGTSSWLLDFLQNITEGSITGGGRMALFRKNRDEIIKQLAEEAAEVAGKTATATQAGGAVLSRAGASKELWEKAVDKLYGELDTLSSGIRVDLSSLRPFVEKELKQLAVTPKGVSGGVSKLLGDMQEIASSGYIANFQQAHKLRSMLLRMTRRLDDPQAAATRGLAQQLAKRVDDAMEFAARGGITTPAHMARRPVSEATPLLEAYRKASGVRRVGAEKFEGDFIRKLMDTDPEKVVSMLAAPRNASNVNRTLRVLGPQSEAANELRSAYIKTILEKATDASSGNVSGKTILRELKRLGDTNTAMLPKDVLANLDEFAQVLDLIQRKQGKGTGRVWIQLAQSGAAYDVLRGALGQDMLSPLVSGTILGVPPVIARAFSNPKASRLIIEGMKLPTGSREAITAFSRAMALVQRGEPKKQENPIYDILGVSP